MPREAKAVQAVQAVQQQGAEVPTEVLATAILAMSEGIKKLRAGRLNDRALYLLIQNASVPVGQFNGQKPTLAHIKSVIDGMESLATTFLRKPTR